MKASYLSIFWVGFALVPNSVFGQNSGYTCSASQPCSVGCCSKSGFCGLGPDYCGAANCISTCDQKSQCDPGWGSQWSSAEKCPLNVCCSQYGFCGTTSEFCGNETVTSPSCSGTSAAGRTVGYYEGWSMSRTCDGMAPEAIPAGAYTHLNYAFAYVDPSSYEIAPMSESDLGLYSRVVALKASYPNLQVWISVGGWSMNDPDQPTASTFSNLAGSNSAQQSFIQSLLSFMSTYGFDGVDIDWEYPVASDRSGNPADFANYPKFLNNLKGGLALSGHNYGLSITLPSSYWYMQNFDIVNIEPIVDWFNVMTYDLHGTWDSNDPYIGPYVYAHTNLTEIDQTMQLLWRNNINPSKVNMGLGFYGRSFTLQDPSCTAAGCPFSSGGNPGPCSASSGTLMDPEIEAVIVAGANVALDKTAAVEIVTWDTNQWVSFDNPTTLQMKFDWANGKCIGGTMVWAVSTDDANGTASGTIASITNRNSNQDWSLFGGGTTPQPPVYSQCQWGACGADCPSGLVPVTTGSGSSTSNIPIWSGCNTGVTRNYCCPQSNMPTCSWVGTAPLCKHATCSPGQVAVATDESAGGSTCAFNHKTLCCSSTSTDAAASQCVWVGTSPICSGSCQGSYPNQLTTSTYGYGGDQPCASGSKKFCCSSPVPYQNCAWVTYGAPNAPVSGCPSGQQAVAIEPGIVNTVGITPQSTFCCDSFTQAPPTVSPPNYCQLASDEFVLTDEADPDGNPADLIEMFWYEDECFVVPAPNPGDPDYYPYTYPEYYDNSNTDLVVSSRSFLQLEANRTRAAPAGGLNLGYPKICYTDDDCWNVLDPLHDVEYLWMVSQKQDSDITTLEPRGRTPRFCLGNGVQSGFVGKNYPSTSSLSNSGRKFFAAAVSGIQAGLCASLPIILGERQLGTDYVTEHVTELQTGAQYAQSMLKQTLPSGAVAPGGSGFDQYDWTKIFASDGFFQQTWAQLQIDPPAGLSGTGPSDAMMTAMGSTGDINNLQVLDAGTNSLKAAVWAIFKNIISKKRFNGESPAGQVAFINRLYDTLIGYFASDGVQDSMTYTFQKMKLCLGALDESSVVPQPQGFTFASTLETWGADFFTTMQNNLQSFLKAKITQVIPYWSSQAAIQLYGQESCTATLNALQDKLNNLASNVVIQNPFT